MTSIYFIRHAESDHDWEEDRTRPLTNEGSDDSRNVTKFLRDIRIDCYMSSPYQRSVDTIIESSVERNMDIYIDERFREREKGVNGYNSEMLEKRWADFDFYEESGESLSMVQKRNIEAVLEILKDHEGKNIVIGTHGAALSAILNYFDPSYCYNDFLRIINYMPYIIRLDFEGINCVRKEELLIIEKQFKRKK
jgi:2,3-bisphosphoglycerate-dependent phosphoglycerate mutase